MSSGIATGWKGTKDVTSDALKKAQETSTKAGAALAPVGVRINESGKQVGDYLAPTAEKAAKGITDFGSSVNKKIDENATLAAGKAKTIDGVKTAGAFLGRTWGALWKTNVEEEPKEEEVVEEKVEVEEEEQKVEEIPEVQIEEKEEQEVVQEEPADKPKEEETVTPEAEAPKEVEEPETPEEAVKEEEEEFEVEIEGIQD